MATSPNPAAETAPDAGRLACASHHDLDWQRLRILRCTAQAMANGPGGLRFKAGTRPWLDGLPAVPTGRNRLRANAGQPPATP